MSKRVKDEINDLRREVAGLYGLMGRVCKNLGMMQRPDEKETRQEKEIRVLQAWCREREEEA